VADGVARYLTIYDTMVHYIAPLALAQTPPPICPKCGSHRTEIVGRSKDGETLVLRCHACGARSELSLPRESAPAVADHDAKSATA
jgi:hypothetical protein